MRRLFWIFVIVSMCAGCGRKSKEELYAAGLELLSASNAGGAVVLFKSALEKDENFFDARFQLARAYAKLGKLEQAEKEYLKVQRQNPLRDEILLELAHVYNSSKKPQEAFKLGEQYLAKHPGSADGFEILGLASAASQKFEDAERYLLQAQDAEPARVKTKFELASVYLAQAKEPKAKSLLEALVRTDQKNVKAWYMLAAIEARGGNSKKALEIYQKISAENASETFAVYKTGLIFIENGELAKAERLADELMAGFPQKADGHRLKGLALYHAKNYAEAMVHLQNSLKIAPTLEGFHFLGLCYYNRGELESALSQFRKILDNIPESRQARLMTGTILLTQKRIDDAITEIRKVLQTNDGDALAHNLLGNAYMAKGMFEEGLREYNIATRLDPKIVDAYLKKGYFYFSRGKNAQGETELATAVQAAPDAVNSRLILAAYHQRTGKSDKALSVLRAGLSGKKSDALILNSIAAILLSQNKMEDAIKHIQKAKAVDPAFPASYQNLVTIYAATGKYDQAVEEYAVLLRNDPKNLRAMLGLAVLYEIKGHDGDALAQYKKAAESKQPEGFVALATYYQKKKETKKALATLEDALKNDSRNAQVLEMKGRLLAGEKKYKDALKTFDEIELQNPDAGIALKIGTYVSMKETAKAVDLARKIIEKNPSSARGYIILASIYESEKDMARAISEARNGVRVDGNNLKAMLYLGKLVETTRDYTQAMAIYTDALRKKPDFVPAIFAQGALLDLTGKKQEAVDRYKMVLEKSDSYVPALNNLAYLMAEGYGSKEQALRLAISAYKQEPGNPGILDTLGFALLKNGRLADAKRVLDKAVIVLANNPTVHYHMALVSKQSGDLAGASRSVEKALSLGNFPDAGAARQLAADLKKKG